MIKSFRTSGLGCCMAHWEVQTGPGHVEICSHARDDTSIEELKLRSGARRYPAASQKVARAEWNMDHRGDDAVEKQHHLQQGLILAQRKLPHHNRAGRPSLNRWPIASCSTVNRNQTLKSSRSLGGHGHHADTCTTHCAGLDILHPRQT